MIFFSWRNACKPHVEGGLNIKEAFAWNRTLMCKWMYKLITRKGIWATWATNRYVNQSSFWLVSAKQTDSCAWKNLLSVRDQLVNRVGSPLNAFNMLKTWIHNDQFSSLRAYNFWRSKGEIKHWHKVIWDSAIIPKHAVISNLAVQNALPTLDNFIKRGFHGPNFYQLCGKDEETSAHLFFNCSFSKEVLYGVKAWANINHISTNFRLLLWLRRRHFKKDKWVSKIAKVAIAATVYLTWMERNARIFYGEFHAPHDLLRNIKFMVSIRMLNHQDSRSEDEKTDLLLD